MVAQQFGISIVPMSVASRFEDRISIVPINSLKIDWEVALIYKKNKYLSYAAREFISYIKNKNSNYNPVE